MWYGLATEAGGLASSHLVLERFVHLRIDSEMTVVHVSSFVQHPHSPRAFCYTFALIVIQEITLGAAAFLFFLTYEVPAFKYDMVVKK